MSQNEKSLPRMLTDSSPVWLEQVAAVGVEGRSPDNVPGWVSRLIESGVDFADHLLLGGGPVLIDMRGC